MTYKLNKTDGSLLTEVVDSTIDQTATDLTLIGKNVSGFGEYINENFIKLLENFSNTSEPNNPITGQLWFDTSQNRLKVYDGQGWKQGSGPIVSGSPPLQTVQGDFWIDSLESQLYFDTAVGRFLAGKIWKDSQGRSGFEVVTLADSPTTTKTVVYLYVGGTLLGIFSKHPSAFTPVSPITGFTGQVYPGFNAADVNNIKFRVTATKADALVDAYGNIKTASAFMAADGNTTTTGRLTIQNNQPLILGSTQNYEVYANTTSFQLVSNNSGQNYQFRIKNPSGTKDGITINATSERVGIFQPNPSYNLDVTGDARITGNLVVEGATTSIETVNLVIEDKNIILGNVAGYNNITAEAGGITLKGTTDKTFNWLGATNSWTSSEHVNLASGKEFKINGVTVLTANSLGASITSAPGITAFGLQTIITVDNLVLDGNRISSSNANGDIELDPNGSGNLVLIGSPRITGLADPVNAQDSGTKNYIDTNIRARFIALSMDVTNLSNSQIAAYIEEIAPATNFESGTYCRVHCTEQIVNYPTVNFTSSIGSSPQNNTTGNFVKYYVAVDKAGGSENQPVLEDFNLNTVNLGAATITVRRTGKLFQKNAGTLVWTFVSIFSGPTIT